MDLEITALRKPFQPSMMRAAIAGRIILSINALRKFLLAVLGRLSFASYSILGFALIFAAVASYCQSELVRLPLLFLAIQSSILPFVDGAGANLSNSHKNDGPRIAIYERVSSRPQAHNYSLPDQDQQLIAYANKNLAPSYIYKIAEVESGTDFARPGIFRILELAAKNLIQTVLVTRFERLGRDEIESLYLARRLREQGVKLVSVQEGEADIKTEQGLLNATIRFLLAELDNIRRKAVCSSAKIQSFKSMHWGLPVPIGYRKRSDGWIEKDPNPEWSRIIVEIFKKFLETHSYQAVLNYMKHHSSPLARQIKRHQLEAILKNPIYAGKPRYSDKATVDDATLACVDLETFESAREISASIGRRHRRVKEDSLTVLMKKYGIELLDFIPRIGVQCKRCGRIMGLNGTDKFKGWIIRIYRCACGSQRIVPTRTELRKIEEFYSNRERAGKSKLVRNRGHRTATTDEKAAQSTLGSFP